MLMPVWRRGRNGPLWEEHPAEVRHFRLDLAIGFGWKNSYHRNNDEDRLWFAYEPQVGNSLDQDDLVEAWANAPVPPPVEEPSLFDYIKEESIERAN